MRTPRVESAHSSLRHSKGKIIYDQQPNNSNNHNDTNTLKQRLAGVYRPRERERTRSTHKTHYNNLSANRQRRRRRPRAQQQQRTSQDTDRRIIIYFGVFMLSLMGVIQSDMFMTAPNGTAAKTSGTHQQRRLRRRCVARRRTVYQFYTVMGTAAAASVRRVIRARTGRVALRSWSSVRSHARECCTI